VLDANQYTGTYPIKGGAPVALSPQIGGGPSTAAPGSDPADYGVNLKVTALIFFTAANGTAALRNTIVDLQQHPPAIAENLSGPLAAQTFATNNNIEIGIVGGDLDFNLKGSVIAGNTVP